MPRFNKSMIHDFKDFFYRECRCVHDAEVVNGNLNWSGDSIKLELFHSYFGVKTTFTFYTIDIAFAIKGKEFGSRNAIYSFTIEEDFSYLQKYIPACSGYDDSLYLLFQMFSGDEMHVVAKEVAVEIANKIVLNNSDADTMEIHHEVKNEGQKDNQAFVETTSSYPASIFTATDAIQHNSEAEVLSRQN